MDYETYVNPLRAVFTTHGVLIVGAFVVLYALGGRVPALRFILLVIGLVLVLSQLDMLPF